MHGKRRSLQDYMTKTIEIISQVHILKYIGPKSKLQLHSDVYKTYLQLFLNRNYFFILEKIFKIASQFFFHFREWYVNGKL